MRKVFTVLTMLLVVNTMTVFANTIRGFMPGRVNRQTVTQAPGTFGFYKETESKTINKKTGEPYMDTSFVKSFDDRPFDIEKASEIPIKPNIKLTDEQKMEGILKYIDDRPFVKVHLGSKVTKLVHINLPQR